MKRVVLFITLTILLVSCVSKSNYDKVLKENEELKIQMQAFEELKIQFDKMKEELSGYKNAPDILYAQVLECVNKNDRNRLASICDNLRKYHPNALRRSKHWIKWIKK